MGDAHTDGAYGQKVSRICDKFMKAIDIPYFLGLLSAKQACRRWEQILQDRAYAPVHDVAYEMVCFWETAVGVEHDKRRVLDCYLHDVVGSNPMYFISILIREMPPEKQSALIKEIAPYNRRTTSGMDKIRELILAQLPG